MCPLPGARTAMEINYIYIPRSMIVDSALPTSGTYVLIDEGGVYGSLSGGEVVYYG